MRWIHKFKWRHPYGIREYPFRYNRTPKIFYTIINFNSKVNYRLGLMTENDKAWNKRRSVPVFRYQIGNKNML